MSEVLQDQFTSINELARRKKTFGRIAAGGFLLSLRLITASRGDAEGLFCGFVSLAASVITYTEYYDCSVELLDLHQSFQGNVDTRVDELLYQALEPEE